MKLKMRKYEREDDFWRIRVFLREVFILNDRREHSWPVQRLDYWRWHVIRCCTPYEGVGDVTYIWGDEGGEIMAVLNSESKCQAHFQIHPAAKTPALLTEMLDMAEVHIVNVARDGRKKLWMWTCEHDLMLRELLVSRGYEPADREDVKGHDFYSSLQRDIPDVCVPEGYSIRALGDVEENPQRSWASWRAFHPDEPDEDYEGWEWYAENIQEEPLYRRDLDIVAVSPEGKIVGFCTLWYDDVTRYGYFEPVGVDPDHHRKGLGKAVMTEAMRRMKRMGGIRVGVGGYSTAAISLYRSVMGDEYPVEVCEPWEKVFE